MGKIYNARSTELANNMVQQHYLTREESFGRKLKPDSLKIDKKEFNADSLFLSLSQNLMIQASNRSIEHAKTIKDAIDYNKMMLDEPKSYVLRHEIERHRKFTLSFACLIFFFIGAPLGAIIRKGGLGMPVVISVIMFIIYYIIDNTGYKMAREGLWTAYEGMWLSSAVLLPIGIFLTYKAVVDATLFNTEHYKKIWNYIKMKLYKLLRISTES